MQKLAAGDMDAVDALSSISPIAWRHVNLVGRFDFTSDATDIDIDALVAPFSDPEFWRKALVEDADEASE